VTVFRRSGYLARAVRYTLGENLGWGQGELGSARAVIMITGTLESRAVSSRLRSSPLMPGM